jgi:hypothetical protein
MGQTELLDLLKERNNWMLAIEIREALNISAGGANRLIKILYENNFIKAKLAKDVIKDVKRLKRTTCLAKAYKII